MQVILADYLVKPSLPLPLVIAHHLGLYFAKCKSEGLIETIGPAGLNAFVQAVAQLVDCFTACERIANVGVPTVYGIHLSELGVAMRRTERGRLGLTVKRESTQNNAQACSSPHCHLCSSSLWGLQ